MSDKVFSLILILFPATYKIKEANTKVLGAVYEQRRGIQANKRYIQELTNHRPVANELQRAKVDIANQNKEANTGHLKQCPLFSLSKMNNKSE